MQDVINKVISKPSGAASALFTVFLRIVLQLQALPQRVSACGLWFKPQGDTVPHRSFSGTGCDTGEISDFGVSHFGADAFETSDRAGK